MAKKNGRDRGDDFDLREDDESNRRGNSGFGERSWSLPETQLKATALLDELLRTSPPQDQRTRQYLLLLRHQLEVDEQQFDEAQKALAEFEEVYQKLTQPANRIGVYLGKPPVDEKKKKDAESEVET